jgi:hypothetical protein
MNHRAKEFQEGLFQTHGMFQRKLSEARKAQYKMNKCCILVFMMWEDLKKKGCLVFNLWLSL